MSNAYAIVMQSRQEIVDRLIAQMEKGYAATREAWSKSATGRPYNPVSDAVYKGGNRFRLMIAAEAYGFSDPRWMTFKQAKEHGYKIAPGATGMLLEKWIFFKDVMKEDQSGKPVLDMDGKPQFERVKLKKPIVNFFRVFNGEQVVGLPELKRAEMTEDSYTDMADTFEKSSRCPIFYEKQDRAFYSSTMDAIYLPPKEAFKNNEARLSVLLHEMSHSTGHPDCLDRKLDNAFGTEMYAREELNAELSAAFLEDELGISLEPDSEMIKDHANYIKSWIAALKDDPNELFRACATAEEITEYLMGNYRAELEREQQEQQEQREEGETQEVKENPDIVAPISGEEVFDPAAEPTVTIIWSEHGHFREGETMSLYQANALMKTLDEEMIEKPFYCKTKFRINYVFGGKPIDYEGRQDLGDGEGTLIDHIEQFHADYINSETWNSWLLRHGGTEALEEDQEQRRWMLNEFVPYLKMHCNLSEMEQIAGEDLDKENVSSLETAYYAAVQEYVTKCRQMINSGDYDLPPVPRLADFDPKLQAYEEIEAYKEHVEDEIAQEAAAAGMTVEEYAANGYEPWGTAGQSVEQSANTQELAVTETKVSYYAINEEAARRAKEANSYDDYVPGSATEEYRRMIGQSWNNNIRHLSIKHKRKASEMNLESSIKNILMKYRHGIKNWPNTKHILTTFG